MTKLEFISALQDYPDEADVCFKSPESGRLYIPEECDMREETSHRLGLLCPEPIIVIG